MLVFNFEPANMQAFVWLFDFRVIYAYIMGILSGLTKEETMGLGAWVVFALAVVAVFLTVADALSSEYYSWRAPLILYVCIVLGMATFCLVWYRIQWWGLGVGIAAAAGLFILLLRLSDALFLLKHQLGGRHE